MIGIRNAAVFRLREGRFVRDERVRAGFHDWIAAPAATDTLAGSRRL